MPGALADIARSVGLNAVSVGDVRQALDIALRTTDEPLRIVICGSLYLAGHVLALQEGRETQSN